MKEIAEEMAKKHKEISVAEFFEKNRHLLGFDLKTKAVVTCVKEAVDNALDACDELNYALLKKGKSIVPPEIYVEVKNTEETFDVMENTNVIGEYVKRGREHLLVLNGKKFKLVNKKENELNFEIDNEKARIIFNGERFKIFLNNKEMQTKTRSKKYRLIVEDNGLGIVKEQIPYTFGKFLYGSKFHRLKESRGQQGIGIHSAVLYAQLTTGKPARITSRISPDKPAHVVEVMIDTVKNEPEIISESIDENFKKERGTRVELEIEGIYISKGKRSVYEYLKQTSIINPYVSIKFKDPDGNVFEFKRKTNEIPKEPREIKPHPHGIELGILKRMIKKTTSRSIYGFLMNEFCKIGPSSAKQIIKIAAIKEKNPKELEIHEIESLLKAMQRVKLARPPLDCLSPIGQENIEKSLKDETGAEFVCALTREPNVYRGMPFQVEAAIAYGGKITLEKAEILRFANKIPLLYDASSCAILKAIQSVHWKNYNIEELNGIPLGPIVILVHFASVWVPYTSEGKSAIASYPIIIKEIKLALQEIARKLKLYLSKRYYAQRRKERILTFMKYGEEVTQALSELTGEKKDEIKKILDKLIKKSNDIVEMEEIKETNKIEGEENERREED
ncbi:MAG: DNA topoisomerase VI subunit B [Candidatus Parvarchaeota archaeon]|nr:DNA topoisomerase VI subunit B [Candidatus Jingweiarchaeum tengchongense]MCW1300104.1 DNA topoisomerase VI subunit B [Candidatus Jingweiarchaeum tengchongense]MCW1304458.1 DNA topoisomerase VI subunit B [Candidatus Jingweiarchaeum tengchongense]MCW1305625.1 DNA topoisomerase VI subunit B [Candidatus Jingweiarchaeum tengchongense]MCW1309254.1 DNA topoisomerase VI subunit B [Candidatus Jingweiarchaeum tengchongense]